VRSVLVKACLNGSRRRSEHPAVPITADELAAEARNAVAAGAGALHVHPRRRDESETLDPDACAEVINEIRRACPGVPVGLSTGAWIESDPSRRIALIEHWTILPNFVSVNFSEPGVVDLCDLLSGRRIGIEAGLWTVGDAETFVASGLAGRCLRVLLEPREEEPYLAIATGRAIHAALDQHGVKQPRLLHGEGPAAWPVLEAALAHGDDIRVGFEDMLLLPNGRRPQGNAELLDEAVRMVRQRGSKPAHPH
jgi:uncharacterized protein (DUF849 family)